MNEWPARIAVALLSAGAGFCVCLVILNRCLILLRDRWWKPPVILLSFAVLVTALAGAGLVLPPARGVAIPGVILFFGLVGEARRAVLRRRYAGSPPVGTVPHDVGYFRPFTTTDVVAHRYALALPEWGGEGLRIVHLSDLHVNPRLPIEYYRRVLELTEQARPDLVFMTGDFVTKPDSLPALAGVLRPLGRVGTYAVLGNHDYWTGGNDIREAVRRAGITVLHDESVTMRAGGGEVQLSGTDYPWGRREPVVPAARCGVARLALSHTPDNIYRLARQRADAVFCGHCHAGQLRIPHVGSVIVPSIYGRRFDHGHFVVRGTHLFVVSGIGAADPALRIYCQPDLFVIDVRGGGAAAEGELEPAGGGVTSCTGIQGGKHEEQVQDRPAGG